MVIASIPLGHTGCPGKADITFLVQRTATLCLVAAVGVLRSVVWICLLIACDLDGQFSRINL